MADMDEFLTFRIRIYRIFAPLGLENFLKSYIFFENFTDKGSNINGALGEIRSDPIGWEGHPFYNLYTTLLINKRTKIHFFRRRRAIFHSHFIGAVAAEANEQIGRQSHLITSVDQLITLITLITLTTTLFLSDHLVYGNLAQKGRRVFGEKIQYTPL